MDNVFWTTYNPFLTARESRNIVDNGILDEGGFDYKNLRQKRFDYFSQLIAHGGQAARDAMQDDSHTNQLQLLVSWKLSLVQPTTISYSNHRHCERKIKEEIDASHQLSNKYGVADQQAKAVLEFLHKMAKRSEFRHQ